MKENDLSDIIKLIENIEKTFDGFRAQNIRYILESANTIWQKCPLQVGDRVRLLRTPEITEEKAWGWLGDRHFLIEGALATVQEREFYNGKFVFSLYFDDETWIDPKGQKHKTDQPSLFFFSEDWLEKIDSEMVKAS